RFLHARPASKAATNTSHDFGHVLPIPLIKPRLVSFVQRKVINRDLADSLRDQRRIDVPPLVENGQLARSRRCSGSHPIADVVTKLRSERIPPNFKSGFSLIVWQVFNVLPNSFLDVSFLCCPPADKASLDISDVAKQGDCEERQRRRLTICQKCLFV